jgi:hypothetical protein
MRAGRQDLMRQLSAALEHMLAVVQNKEHPLLVETLNDRVNCRPARVQRQTKR